MYIVRGITAILAGLVLLALSGTPTLTAEASLAQPSIAVTYDGEEKTNPDFNVVDWFPGTSGQQTVDIINTGNHDTEVAVTAGNFSDNSLAHDTDVTVALLSGDVLYEGNYSDMNETVVVPQGKTLTLNMAVTWNPPADLPSDVTLEALGLHIYAL